MSRITWVSPAMVARGYTVDAEASAPLSPIREMHSRLQAAERAILATHQYTKRQMTWFRHQKLVDSPAMQIIHSRIDGFAQFSESFYGDLVNFINDPG